jgi:hypothetical protein
MKSSINKKKAEKENGIPACAGMTAERLAFYYAGNFFAQSSTKIFDNYAMPIMRHTRVGGYPIFFFLLLAGT